MHLVNKKKILQKIFLPAILFPLFLVFFLSVSTQPVSAAAVCVTNPETEPPCPLSVTLTPVSSTVSAGGNTNISVTAEPSILQYDVALSDLEIWMRDNVTGIDTQLFWTGTWPSYGQTRTVNTGPLTNSVTISAWVMNMQGTQATASTIITVIGAPTGTINVTSNIPGASFTLTGPATLTGSVPATFTSQPTGMYTITWNNVLEYTKPGTSSQTLTSGGTLSFSGNYTPSTGPAANTCYWQTWFDPAGPGCMGDMSGEGYLLVGQTQDYSDAGTKWCGFCTAGPGASCSNTNVSGSTYRFTCNSTAPTIDVHF